MFKSIGFLLIGVSAVCFSSCKKDSTESQTTLQKIQHRWVFQREVDKGTGTGAQYIDTVKGITGDYYDFQADYRLFRRRQGIADTINYSVAGDSKIIFSSLFSLPDTFDIQVLDNNNFQFNSSVSSGGFVNEATIFLTR